MNHEEEFEYRQQLESYIINSNVNTILQSLLEEIIIKKPENPLDFMIEKLEQPEREINFVIGPPGLRVFSLLEKVREEMTDAKYQTFNCGEYVNSIKEQLTARSQQQISEGLLIHKKQNDQKILSKLKDIHRETNKNLIIEGYPKSLEQAVSLQHAHIPPTKIILMNVSPQHLNEICTNKLKSIQANMSEEELAAKVEKMVMEYTINIRELKQFYNEYSEIDLTKGNNDQKHIVTELRRAFEVKTVSLTPRTCSQVLIIGAPHSGRTTLAKSFAKFYNLVYVSTRALISNEIRKDSIAGRKIKSAFLNNQLIDEFTIQKLIEERISQTDCLMQGFVLEGYPKTQDQYENMKNLNVRPTLTVAIDLPQEESLKRAKQGAGNSKRYEKWIDFKDFLRSRPQKMFWVDSSLSQDNMFEEVKFEFQKRK